MDEDDTVQILILTTGGLSLFDAAAEFTGQLEAASSNHRSSTITSASTIVSATILANWKTN